MKNIKFLYVFLLIVIPFFTRGQKNQFTWPNGAITAVCMTYDDAINTHLDIAIPDLNEAGLHGTFFIQGSNVKIDRIKDWREASSKGHELGNHTAYHPCRQALDFIDEDFATENYSVNRILLELKVMNTFLYAIDGETVRTFAYTCGDIEYGGVSIVDSLRKSGLFIAARGTSGGVTRDFKDMDLMHVKSGSYIGSSGKELVDFVKEARDVEGLAVITFHGVGGDYLDVSREAHKELISYLEKNKASIWTATFRDVMQHIIDERKRLGWNGS